MRDRLRGKSVTISRERANSIRPILRWIKEGASRKRERMQAASILEEIEGISAWKQVILTKGEAQLLSFIYTEFPEGVEVEKQQRLFPQEAAKTVVIAVHPKLAREEKPQLKGVLTREEQDEREKAGLTRLGPGQKAKKE